MIKELLWVVFMQMILNPFTLFVVLGVLMGGQGLAVVVSFVVSAIWMVVWFKTRQHFWELDQRAANIWILQR